MTTENEEVTNEETSREDDVAAAFDKHEAVESSAEGTAPEKSAAEPPPVVDGENERPEKNVAEKPATDGRDAAGRFAPRTAQTGQPDTSLAPQVEDKLVRAPASWKPEEAQHWTKAPKEVREAVMRREAEIQRGMQEASSSRRAVETIQEVIGPYVHNLQAAKSDAVTAIKTFFQYDNTLRHGTNLEKAQMMTQLIKNYGVDIEALDSALAGAAPRPEDATQSAIQQALQRELAPIREMMANQRRAQEQHQMQVQENVRTDLGRFAETNPHFDAVRIDMADLLDIAAAQGRELTLKEAYERACWQNPQIRSILLAEQSRTAGKTQTQQAQQARRAAVSVRNTPVAAAGAANSGKRSRLDDIAAAFDAHAGGE